MSYSAFSEGALHGVDAALAIAAAGVPVFPCKAIDKSPALGTGIHKATTDETQIRGWWGRTNNFLVGACMGPAGGLFGVDVDHAKPDKNKTCGFEALSEIGVDPDSFDYVATTQSGGKHMLFAWADGLPSLTVGRDVGLDCRGSGGYLVAWEPQVIVNAANAAKAGTLQAVPADILELLLKAHSGRPAQKKEFAFDAFGGQSVSDGHTLQDLEAMLAAVPFETLSEFEWSQMAYAAHTAFGDDGLRAWIARSEQVEPNSALTIRVANSVRDVNKGEVGLGTLKWRAQQNGWRDTRGFNFDFDGKPAEKQPASTPANTPSNDDMSRLERLTWWEIGEMPKPDYLVKGWLERDALAVMFGQPGAGKTFVTIDMALAIARGEVWHGARTRQGRVLYVAAEGLNGLKRRFRAAVGMDGDLPKGQLAVMSTAVFIDQVEALTELVAFVDKVGGFDVIVFDTLARSMLGDENSSQEMGRVIAAAGALKERYGCTVVFVHHSGKDTAKGARGSSALLGAVDTEIEVKKGEDMIAEVCSTKQKEGEELAVKLKLQRVVLGKDDDGDEITSLKVAGKAVQDEAKAFDRGAAVAKLKGNEAAVYRAVEDACHERGTPLRMGDKSFRVTSHTEVKIAAASVVTGDSEAQRKQNVRNCIGRLRDKKLLAWEDDRIWLTVEIGNNPT